MKTKIFTYPFIVKETYLDFFGHVNNAAYLILYEEARWDLITRHGYGVQQIKETGLGPVILEVKLCFLKELQLRQEIIIETQFLTYQKKIGTLRQQMIRDKDICSTLDLSFGLFNLKERKLVPPTQEWLKAIGVEL